MGSLIRCSVLLVMVACGWFPDHYTTALFIGVRQTPMTGVTSLSMRDVVSSEQSSSGLGRLFNISSSGPSVDDSNDDDENDLVLSSKMVPAPASELLGDGEPDTQKIGMWTARLLLLLIAHNLLHPHLTVGPDSSVSTTRFLGSVLPLKWLHHVRDNGGFRDISDNLVKMSFLLGGLTNPSAARLFLQLTNQVHRIPYGCNHEYQYIDMFFPTNGTRESVAGLVFFVHGGAWGSGRPWIYRLAARPFLKLNLAVAIVGYRVYPDGNVKAQVQDLVAAHQKLSELYPELCGPSRRHELIVMGHSSGAHIALLMLVEQVMRLMLVHEDHPGRDSSRAVDKFIGLSGPYNVSHQFDHEATRGVEELSPLKPACGYSREHFQKNSPVVRLQEFLASNIQGKELCPSKFFPLTLLVHGMEDTVVPFTATSEAARGLKACGVSALEEYYAPKTQHQDTVVQLMLGGMVERFVAGWLKNEISPLLQAPANSKM
eukprot:scaffold4007_cov111-Cylindrotheca_fusiformis.AAC.2